jgi:SAM-dependent methyltransferase
VTHGAIGWDHPETARAYRRFHRRSDRYRKANRALVNEACLRPGLHLLDLGAGAGGTAVAALPHLGEHDRILCVEPAAAMRRLGRATLRDERVGWASECPAARARFDRVLCGAAMWQMNPLERTFSLVHALLRPGGCLAFNVPALYLGEPDPPGGGRDPHLLELPQAIAQETISIRVTCEASGADAPTHALPGGNSPARHTVHTVGGALERTGFRARRWSFSIRFRQDEYREWLRIPPTTDGLLRGVQPRERERLIERAFRHVDERSWRWERWVGWTAWKPA